MTQIYVKILDEKDEVLNLDSLTAEGIHEAKYQAEILIEEIESYENKINDD